MMAAAPMGGTPQEECGCCRHEACATLRKQQWCRHWVFLRWVSPKVHMPSDISTELDSKLPGCDFTHCLAQSRSSGTTIHEIILNVKSIGGFGQLSSLLGSPEGSAAGEGSQAWVLRCCLRSLRDDAAAWVQFVQGSQKKNKAIFGDKELCDFLVKKVREATHYYDDDDELVHDDGQIDHMGHW